MADVCSFVQILDALVPQRGNQVLEVFRLLDSVVPEQVIDVPKISQDTIQQRLADRDLRHAQLAEQLVEVPTILSLSLLQHQSAEQNNPVPRGRRGVGGGLQSFLPVQNSTAPVSQHLVATRSRVLPASTILPSWRSTAFSGNESAWRHWSFKLRSYASVVRSD